MEKERRLQPIECSGTLYEIGRQYGEACGEKLSIALDEYFRLFTMNPAKPDRVAVRGVALKFLGNARSFDPEGVSFIEGQAEGAGLDFGDVFTIHCMIEVLFNYQNLAAMCTSFAVTGEATHRGMTIIGQNVDWFVSSPVDLLKISYQDGLKAFVLCLSGVPYYHFTSAGLANCANLTLGPPPRLERQVPLGIYLPKAMRQKNIAAALSVLKQAARGYGYYHVADAGGNVAGIESIDGDYTIIRPERGVIVHANHYETEKYRQVDWTEQIVPCTRIRSSRLRELIEGRYGKIIPQVMMELLCDHQSQPNCICKHPDPAVPPEFAAESRASFVIVPEERTMYLSSGPPCEGGYTEYRL